MSDRKITVDLHDIMACRFYFNWGGRGFGQYSIGVDTKDIDDGKALVISGSRECMSKESLRQGLHAAIDAIIDALPADKDFGDDFFQVVVPTPKEVLDARDEWLRKTQERFPGLLDEDQDTSDDTR